MGIPYQVMKHVGVPLGIGGALYAINAPKYEPLESLRRKWDRTRDAWAAGGAAAGVLGASAINKAVGKSTNRYAKVLSLILGGAGGALAGANIFAPKQHMEEVRIRRARRQYPGGINPLTGARVFATPEQLYMDPSTTYRTERWGVQ